MTKDPKNFASAPAPADAPPKERRRKRDIVKGILKKVADAPKSIGDIKWPGAKEPEESAPKESDPPPAPAVAPPTPASTAGKESADLDWLDEMTKDPKNFASAPAPADAPPKERRRKRDIVKGILKKVVDAPKAIGDIKWRAPKANDDFSWASSDKGDERSEAEEKTSEAATPEKTAADKAEDLARLEAAWMRGWKLAEGGLKR